MGIPRGERAPAHGCVSVSLVCTTSVPQCGDWNMGIVGVTLGSPAGYPREGTLMWEMASVFILEKSQKGCKTRKVSTMCPP